MFKNCTDVCCASSVLGAGTYYQKDDTEVVVPSSGIYFDADAMNIIGPAIMCGVCVLVLVVMIVCYNKTNVTKLKIKE